MEGKWCSEVWVKRGMWSLEWQVEWRVECKSRVESPEWRVRNEVDSSGGEWSGVCRVESVE